MSEEKTIQPGIFLKLGKHRIRYTGADGEYHREIAGTLAAAKRLLRKRQGEAVEGKLPSELRRRGAARWSELCDDTKKYIEQEYAKPKHDLGRLEVIRGWFGDRAAASLRVRDIKSELERAKQEKRWSASSWNHHHTLLSLTFRLAIENEKVERSPMSGVKRMKEDNSRVRYLTPDEEAKLREVIRKNPAWADHEPELTLSLSTGLRHGDMYERLVWENVDLIEKVATIPRSKNDDPVHIPLNTDAIHALVIFRSRSDGTGRVVRNAQGEPLLYNNFWFVPAVRTAGIKNFKWHDCRHTFASRLRQRGVPLGNIAELLGHKGLAMTKRYAHLAISNLHQAVALLETNQHQISTEPVVPVGRVQ